MRDSKRRAIIISIFTLTILICTGTGFLYRARMASPNSLAVIGMVSIGLTGTFLSMLIGSFVDFLLRHKTRGTFSLSGYLVPSLVTVGICTIQIIML